MKKMTHDSKLEWKGSRPQKFYPGKLTYTHRPSIKLNYDP